MLLVRSKSSFVVAIFAIYILRQLITVSLIILPLFILFVNINRIYRGRRAYLAALVFFVCFLA